MFNEPSKIRILVADDEEMLSDLISDYLDIILDTVPFSVVIAARVSEAIAEIGKNEFHLVITDINFPDGLGFSILDAAKKKNPKTKVFLMSGMSENFKRSEALQADMTFQKPVNMMKLDEALHHFGFV